MTEGSGPAVTIALRDGSELRITPAGIHVGDRFIEIGRLQDARQVAPDPLTIAVRASGERQLIEFQPQQPQEGAVALEAIYRIRPDLRPAGFATPASVPGAWPPAPPPPPYGAPPYGPYGPMPYPPPQPGGYPPQGYAPYGPPPTLGYQDTSGGRFTPFPRDIGSILSAVFSLFGAHWRVWILLGLLVSFIPSALSGVGQVLIYLGFGLDPWGPPANTTVTVNANTPPPFPFGSTPIDPLFFVLAGALTLVGALLGALEVAAIGIAARDAVLGQPVRVGRSIAGGIRRFFSVLATNIISGLIALLLFLPVGALVVATVANLPNALNGSSDAGAATASLLGCTALLVAILTLIASIYVSIRLVVAPYIAATERLGPFKAIGKSWALTHGQWWHTFLPILIIGLLSVVVVVPASFVQFFSYAGSAVIAIPLVSALIAPFSGLVTVIILYDLRLRREGYQAVAQQEGEPQPASTIQG